MRLSILENAAHSIERMIFISGVARSGTTILGKVIHSMQNVEYAFEPPMLFSLMPLIEKLPNNEWKLLFETYLYEDFLINAVSGRSINCNKSDDSSIYRVKELNDVEARLNNSTSKLAAIEMANSKILAIKMPDMACFFLPLKLLYPNLRTLVIRRNAADVINSLVQKNWFSNEVMNQGLLWPFNKHYPVHIPFWVKVDDYELW